MGFQTAFFFREMSDLNVLARIFLPTPGVASIAVFARESWDCFHPDPSHPPGRRNDIRL